MSALGHSRFRIENRSSTPLVRLPRIASAEERPERAHAGAGGHPALSEVIHLAHGRVVM